MSAAAQDIITTKLTRHFDTLDVDQDGYLSWADYKKLADRYIEAYQLAADDRRARTLMSFFQIYWLELLRHAGVETDRLAKSEFVTANRVAVVDSSRLNVTEGAAHAIFDVIDVDGDNEISQGEFARSMRDVWGVAAPDAMDSFARLDLDGDGAISRQEFIRAVQEHFLSDDPDAPGSLFFGHL
ncbi:EF-hand domain-containing protein [Streptomyces sp. NPDC091279]|uniref:EF-hand domain-containing protein n=1 Tax=unclassified Streptomyces TaxID=2593676 RepID=UPI0038296CC9